jgi:hypothetical protein
MVDRRLLKASRGIPKGSRVLEVADAFLTLDHFFNFLHRTPDWPEV